MSRAMSLNLLRVKVAAARERRVENYCDRIGAIPSDFVSGPLRQDTATGDGYILVLA